MLKKILFLLTVCVFQLNAQNPDSLIINYYENMPMAYSDGAKPKGIEIDIVEEYINWLKTKKNIAVAVSYKSHKDFNKFYDAVKNGSKNSIGCGSVTFNRDREKDVCYSPAYMQNVAVLVTDGNIPSLKTKSVADITPNFRGLNAWAIPNSSHYKYLENIKIPFMPSMIINSAASQNQVLDEIAKDKNNIGYVDIVAFWTYLKNNNTKFLKIQKVFNETNETLGFIMPKTNLHQKYLNEFFESGFGFTSTKKYRQILENYLGYEIISSVEIK